jgi:hypothetical protein
LSTERIVPRSPSDQVAISTVDKFNGADLGIRQEWVPLFDKYGVDLVVCGHEHDYERSHPIRGREQNATLSPVPAATATDVIDTTGGTVHMVIGGCGTSIPSNTLFFDPPQCRVITAVGEPDPKTGKRPPVYVKEQAPWSAVRNAAHSYGFAASIRDPIPATSQRSKSPTMTWGSTVSWLVRNFRAAPPSPRLGQSCSRLAAGRFTGGASRAHSKALIEP